MMRRRWSPLLFSAFQGQSTPALFWGLPGMNILRLVLLSLAALIAIVLGVSFFFGANEPNPGKVPSAAVTPSALAPAKSLLAAREKIATQIAQESPDYARFFERLKAILPNEYDSILDRFAKQSLEGADMTNVDSLLSEAVRDLRLSSGVLAAKADGPALSRIFDMQLQMMQALAAKDPRLCVDFLYGGASQAFFEFSAENRRLVSDMAIAGLDAIGSGRAHKIDRQPPSDADFNELENAMKAQGLNDLKSARFSTVRPPIHQSPTIGCARSDKST